MQLPWYLRLNLALAPRLGGIVVANIFTTPRRHKRPHWESVRTTVRWVDR
jgi:hypothetical protein